MTKQETYNQTHFNAEIMTIANILGDTNNMQNDILTYLEDKMFISSEYRNIFNACKSLSMQKKEINSNAVSRLTGINLADLQEIEMECVSSINWKYFADILLQDYKTEIVKDAKTIEDFKKVAAELNRVDRSICVEKISQGIENILTDYEKSKKTAIKTGYQSIDNILGSFQGGDYIILAGATGMGKSCLMMNLIKQIAERQKQILIFSLEMSKADLQKRMLANLLGINAHHFRNFSINEREKSLINQVAETEYFKKYNIDICKQYNITTQTIDSVIKKKKYDIVFIDYLGLISGSNKLNSYEKYGNISRDLKIIALENNIPLVILHQLNRSNADRQDKKPRLSDLRDCGKIEQDADMITFVFRPYYYDTQADKTELQFIVAKNRHGKSNTIVSLKYEAETGSIYDNINQFK